MHRRPGRYSNRLSHLPMERECFPLNKLCTNKGDPIPDSFAGSGTTGAVAHKVVIHRCKWAHDDCSLNVENLPMATKDAEQAGLFDHNIGGEK